MVILILFLSPPFSIPFFLSGQTPYSFLAPSGPTEHSRSCSKPCSISNIYPISTSHPENEMGLTQPWIQISLPAPQAVFTAYHQLTSYFAAPSPSPFPHYPQKTPMRERGAERTERTHGRNNKIPNSILYILPNQIINITPLRQCMSKPNQGIQELHKV